MATVTAIVRDPAGNVYANAFVIASFVGQSTTPGAGPYVTGGVPQGQFQLIVPSETDSLGNLSMTITGNDTITPTPSQWNFTVVSNTTPQVSFSVLITITGTTQDISANLVAAAAPLPTTTSTRLGLPPVTVAFSTTPIFNTAQGTSFSMTLTGNVTSSTITNSFDGQIVVFEFIQDAVGSRTVVFPVIVLNAQSPDPTPNSRTVQAFLRTSGNFYPLTTATVN